MNSDRKEIDAIRLRHAAARPGPWGWFGYIGKGGVQMHLATQYGGRKYVMGFERAGMRGAQPTFQSNHRMYTAKELAVREEILTKAHSGEIIGVTHPDMVLIEHAPSDIGILLAEIDRLDAEIAHLRSSAAAA